MLIRNEINLSLSKDFNEEEVLEIYRLNKWSSVRKPVKLIAALRESHTLITAYTNARLIGVGYAISDGHLVVYYPHLLIHPDYQGLGIGQLMMDKFQEIYSSYHMQMLVADGKAIDFYKKCGFVSAGQTKSMWIYKGEEH